VIVAWVCAGLLVGYLAGRVGQTARTAAKGFAVNLGAREARTARLEDMIEAARAMALRIERHHDGYTVFEQLGPPGQLTVQVADPEHVTVPAVQLSMTTSLTLPFSVALALVPVFGPLTVVFDGEVFEVDGSRDQHALQRELSRRFTARARTLLATRAQP
jgi:hypothetical protein